MLPRVEPVGVDQNQSEPTSSRRPILSLSSCCRWAWTQGVESRRAHRGGGDREAEGDVVLHGGAEVFEEGSGCVRLRACRQRRELPSRAHTRD
eukprot:1564801-Rhodomonas_salina.1